MNLLRADARHIPLADGVVQTVVTSPPYYALRDYGLGDSGIGLEKSPDEYVSNIVQVFREVWRVLWDNATCWINLGDCYAGGGRGGGGSYDEERPGWTTDETRGKRSGKRWGGGNSAVPGLKPKDLVGIPWRVAFALQADGWYLRSDIIWNKPNPMPESVTDRPTKSHEYLFLMSKRPRYFYDAEAIREQSQANEASLKRAEYGRYDAGTGAAKRDTRTGKPDYLSADGAHEGNGVRNRRDVWTIPTAPYKGAHFATFPEKLVEPCILAGSRSGDLVLDPFCGSGTVGAVARRLGRRFVGSDMSKAYLELAKERIGSVTLGMAL